MARDAKHGDDYSTKNGRDSINKFVRKKLHEKNFPATNIRKHIVTFAFRLPIYASLSVCNIDVHLFSFSPPLFILFITLSTRSIFKCDKSVVGIFNFDFTTCVLRIHQTRVYIFILNFHSKIFCCLLVFGVFTCHFSCSNTLFVENIAFILFFKISIVIATYNHDEVLLWENCLCLQFAAIFYNKMKTM